MAASRALASAVCCLAVLGALSATCKSATCKWPGRESVLLQTGRSQVSLKARGGAKWESLAEAEAALRRELASRGPALTPQEQLELLGRMKALASSELLLMLNTSHNEDQHEVERLRSAVLGCDTRLAGATASQGDAATAAKAAHGQCRVGQAAAHASEAQLRQTLSAYVQGLSPPATPSPMVPGEALAVWLAGLASWAAAQREAYGSKSSAAEDAKSALLNETARCDTLQQAFEAATCEHHALLWQAAAEYRSCRNDTLAFLNASWAELMVTAATRQSTWEAASRIVCYIELLESNSTMQALLDECSQRAINTTFLNLSAPPPVPERPVVDADALLPGDAAWAADAYGALPAAAPARPTAPCPAPRVFALQFGSGADDVPYGVAVHGSSSVYVAGSTSGALFGQTNQGDVDYFLVKYDAAGQVLWARQDGTASGDAATAVTVGADGAVYVAGWTKGSLARPLSGPSDYWLAKYSEGGSQEWLVQGGGDKDDWPTGTIGLDGAGNVYVGGTRSSAAEYWLAKHAPGGALVWLQTGGSPNWDYGHAVAVDPQGSAFVVGTVANDQALPGLTSSGGADSFLVKYRTDGTVAWRTQGVSSAGDGGYAVALGDSGQVYVSGGTTGALPGTSHVGGDDIWLGAYGADGTRIWLSLLGTPLADQPTALVASGDGSLYLGGKTAGAFSGSDPQGGSDYFLAKCSSNGTALWVRQGGSPEDDQINGLAVDRDGNLYAIGMTKGSLSGQTSQGGMDGFLLKNP